MILFRKLRVKALAFSLFLIGYLSINFINLNDNTTNELHHNPIDSIQLNPIEIKREQDIRNELAHKNRETMDRIDKGKTSAIGKRKGVFNMMIKGESNPKKIDCGNSVEIRQIGGLKSDDEDIDFEVFLENTPSKSEKIKYYYLVYGMESEPHSG